MRYCACPRAAARRSGLIATISTVRIDMRDNRTPATRVDRRACSGRSHGRRRHYVPQFYLKRFGNPLSVFDKKRFRSYKAAPSSVAVEKGFYSDSMEASLGVIEDRAAPAIHEILERKDYYGLDQQKQDSFAEFVAAQMLRTRGTREDISEIRSGAIMDLERLGASTAKVTRGKEADLDTHEKAIYVMLDTIKSTLALMHVLISVNPTPMYLWTSDRPVYVYNDLDPCEGTNRSIRVKGATINIPLSPSLKVGFCDPLTYMYTRSSRMGTANVRRHNYLQALCSTRFVYSRDEFSGAESLLDTARQNGRRRSCGPAPGASDFQLRPDAGRREIAGRFWMPLSPLPATDGL